MSNDSNICPRCGGVVPAEAPQGLCPKCLLAAVSVPTAAGQPQGERPVPPTIDELAAAFPQLEILELIGQGGMGFVFKARQARLDRFVALKILPKSLALDPAFAERFSREGRVLARLNHPNIVTVYDFGLAGGYFFLMMEYVDGVNLRQAMHAGRFTPGQALAVVPKICDALQFAHNEGILHRDIKPENILLDSKGRVKIADFGIAKLIGEPHGDARLTASGASLGTPHYMAPEQIEKPGEVDHRADIYSLGVVFYEMLTGELPLGRFAPPSQKSTADPRLDDVVFRTLEKEPANRPQSAGEVKTQVETIGSTPRPKMPAASPGGAKPRKSPVLKTSRSLISSPEHLRTLIGNVVVFTGRGDLSLNAENLLFSDARGSVTIPLRFIRNVRISQFPVTETWRRIDFIAVSYEDAGTTRTLLFTPFEQWMFSPRRLLVEDWFDAIRDAVIEATGHEPDAALPPALIAPMLPGWKRKILLLAQTSVVTAIVCGLTFPLMVVLFQDSFFNAQSSKGPLIGLWIGGVACAAFVFTAWWRHRMNLRAVDFARPVAARFDRFRNAKWVVVGAISFLLAPLLAIVFMLVSARVKVPASPMQARPPQEVDMKPGSRSLYYKWLPINRDPIAGVTVTADVDIALFPAERISAWQKTSDEPLEEATHIQAEFRRPGGMESHQSFAWTLPAWISKGENWALQDRLQRTPTAPLLLAPDKPVRLFSVTNSEGKVFEGNVLLTRPRAEAGTPDRPEAVIRFSDFSVVIVDPATVVSRRRMSPAMMARYHLESAPSEVPIPNRLDVRASVNVPPGYTLETYFRWETNRFQEPSGEWMAESREIRSAHTNYYQSTWLFPDSFSGNEVHSALAQSALVPLEMATVAISIPGGRTLKVFPFKTYQLFALTNQVGEVFRGGYDLIVPSAPRLKH